MRIRGVLLGTVEEQTKGGDEQPIDPERVELFEDGHVPVSLNFDLTKTFGKVVRIWRADGRIMFEAELDAGATKAHGVDKMLEEKMLRQAAFSGTVDGPSTEVFGISLTDENVNRDQPPWDAIDG